MGKSVFIAEKPSVAREFAKVLGFAANETEGGSSARGYLEKGNYIVTWCVGHLVSMSYPDAYDPALKKWSMTTLPFIPQEYRYEIIPDVKKQFDIVTKLLTRDDVEHIYVCTDSGREGEYIYRLVEMMSDAKVYTKDRRRVWIDSQTEAEIKRGIKEAKPLAEYDNLSASAYLRAKEDYLIGINFSRLMSLKFSNYIAPYIGKKYASLAIGRVMTCVLAMVVFREREIRNFVKTPFYRVLGRISPDLDGSDIGFDAEWRAVAESFYFEHPKLYKENGFKKKEDAEGLILSMCRNGYPVDGVIEKAETKVESKNAPLLFNLAELQNECSKRFKISPDQTLNVIQELYEKKMVTYPRTDARVLSTAVAKEIDKNINGLVNFPAVAEFAKDILNRKSYLGIEKTRYTDDKKITDHYAVIPTGQGLGNYGRLSPLNQKIYEMICRRFLAIFYPPAKYKKMSLEVSVDSAALTTDTFDKSKESREHLFASFKVQTDEGYLAVYPQAGRKKAEAGADAKSTNGDGNASDQAGDNTENEEIDVKSMPKLLEYLGTLKKGAHISFGNFSVKDGETSPPSRYNSGSIILAMENAGQLIEDEELRAQIKGSGIGTSATRGDILKKLVNNGYLKINTKTQVVTPELFGELIVDVCEASMRQILNPVFTASWEKGLNMVAEGTITSDEYMAKLEKFITDKTVQVKAISHPEQIRQWFDRDIVYYRK